VEKFAAVDTSNNNYYDNRHIIVLTDSKIQILRIKALTSSPRRIYHDFPKLNQIKKCINKIIDTLK